MMNTLNKTYLTATAALAIAGSGMALANPEGEKDEEKSPQKLAEELRQDLNENSEAFQDLIRRAMENGGRLELDMDEFKRLMQDNGGKSKVMSPKDFERLLGEDWMKRLGQGSQQVDDDAEDSREEAKDAMKGFLDMFQQRLRGRRVGQNEREHGSILDDYRPVVAEARKSTVSLVAGRQQVALGTVVDAGGYVVTKASEVVGKDLRCVFPAGVRVSAKVVDIHEPLDLALVKVGAEGLEPAQWADEGSTELGTFLAAPGIGEDPVAIGVASVAPRSLSEKTKGFLGVFPEEVDGKVVLRTVGPDSPAGKAGLQVGDIVLEIDGEKVDNTSKFRRLIADHSPGDKVGFKVSRGDEELDVTAKLISREAGIQTSNAQRPRNSRIDRMNQMGGKLSGTREGFVSVLQTDLTLEPSECGGPVVNLDGKIVGVNIARGGRVKSYAVPAKELRALLGDVGSGKFSVSDVARLERAAEEAGEALQKAQAALEAAKAAKTAADKALKEARDK